MIRTTSSKNPDDSFSAVDLTPLIDIVFIMIVFLILCMNQPVASLPFELPTTKSSNASQNVMQAKTILLYEHPPYYGLQDPNSFEPQFDSELSGQRFQSIDALIASILMAGPAQSQTLQIASNPATPVQALLELLDQLKATGFETSNILMEKK